MYKLGDLPSPTVLNLRKVCLIPSFFKPNFLQNYQLFFEYANVRQKEGAAQRVVARLR